MAGTADVDVQTWVEQRLSHNSKFCYGTAARTTAAAPPGHLNFCPNAYSSEMKVAVGELPTPLETLFMNPILQMLGQPEQIPTRHSIALLRARAY